mgnify:CR=1 FL=1
MGSSSTTILCLPSHRVLHLLLLSIGQSVCKRCPHLAEQVMHPRLGLVALHHPLLHPHYYSIHLAETPVNVLSRKQSTEEESRDSLWRLSSSVLLILAEAEAVRTGRLQHQHQRKSPRNKGQCRCLGSIASRTRTGSGAAEAEQLKGHL